MLYHGVSPKSSVFLFLPFQSALEHSAEFSALISGMVRESRGVRKPKQNKRIKRYGEVFCDPPTRTVSHLQSTPTLPHELWFGLESKSSVERQGSCYALHLTFNLIFMLCVRAFSLLAFLCTTCMQKEQVGGPWNRRYRHCELLWKSWDQTWVCWKNRQVSCSTELLLPSPPLKSSL